MFEHLRTYLTRPTVFLAAGMAIGALLAPAFGGSAAQGVTTYTRAVSCHGLSWFPTTNAVPYSSVGTLRVSSSYGYFICGVDLPHEAVVTRVRFTLFDVHDGNVRNCALVRAGLTTGTADIAQIMAAVDTTTNIGLQRLPDTTISFATIDNMNYGYYLQCEIIALSLTRQGIYGADITYKITAANG
jgi:hypothetical protein